jgi:hypothetical protein
MFSPYHYEYLCGLAILEEDVDGADLGSSAGPNPSNFLGHGPCLAEIHVGRWKNCL